MLSLVMDSIVLGNLTHSVLQYFIILLDCNAYAGGMAAFKSYHVVAVIFGCIILLSCGVVAS